MNRAKETDETSKHGPDDALVESLRDAFQPRPLQPLQRARIRARVRARLGNEAAERALARRTGSGLVPAAAALAGFLVALVAVLSSERPTPNEGEGPSTRVDDVGAAALLLGEDLMAPGRLVDDLDDEPTPLPPEYRTLSSLLGGPA